MGKPKIGQKYWITGGLFRKKVLRPVFERKKITLKTYVLEMVAMATSCTIFVRKKWFFIANMSKRKVVEAGHSLTYDLSSTKGFVHGRDRG